MTYCYICPACGSTAEAARPDADVRCSNHVYEAFDVQMRRDYRAENAGVNVAQLRNERERGLDGESGRKAQRDIFLPTMQDFAGQPGDPTGEKGMREWNDAHGPRETNKRPLYPDVPKRTFAVS